MLSRNLNNLLRFLKYKKKYLNSKIAFGSLVTDDSVIGKHLQLHSNSCVSSSIIDDNVTLSRGSYISKTELEKNIVVSSDCYITSVKVGAFSYIGNNSNINSTKIGRFCSVGTQFLSGQGDHPTNFISTNPVFFSTLKQCGVSFSNQDYFAETTGVNIGHDVWIGARVFIRDGVKIGNGVVIGAGAVVVKNIPDYAVVGGVPAKIIRFRFNEDIINELLEIEWWNWSENKLRQARGFFVSEDMNSFIKWAKMNTSEPFIQ